jgi:hypothetical protein
MIKAEVTFPESYSYYKLDDVDKFKGAQTAVVQKQAAASDIKSDIIDSQIRRPQAQMVQQSTTHRTPREEITPQGPPEAEDLQKKKFQMLQKAMEIKQELQGVCNKKYLSVPSDKIDPLVRMVSKYIDEANDLMALLLDGGDEDGMAKIFDETQWMEKVLEDHQKISS